MESEKIENFDFKNMEKELEDNKEKIQTLEEINYELRDKINRLKIDHQDSLDQLMRDFNSQMEEMNESKETLEKKNKVLTETIKGLKALVSENQEIRKENQKVMEILTERDRDQKSAEDRFKEEFRNRNLEYKTESERGHHSNSSLSKECERLKIQSEEYEKKIFELEQNEKNKRKRILELEEENKILKNGHESSNTEQNAFQVEEHLQKLFKQLKQTQVALEQSKFISPINNAEVKKLEYDAHLKTPARPKKKVGSIEMQKAVTEKNKNFTAEIPKKLIPSLTPDNLNVSPLKSEIDPSQFSPHYTRYPNIPNLNKVLSTPMINTNLGKNKKKEKFGELNSLQETIHDETGRSRSDQEREILRLTNQILMLRKNIDSKNKIILQQQTNLDLSNKLAFKVADTLEDLNSENEHLRLAIKKYKKTISQLEGRISTMSDVVSELRKRLENDRSRKDAISTTSRVNLRTNRVDMRVVDDDFSRTLHQERDEFRTERTLMFGNRNEYRTSKTGRYPYMMDSYPVDEPNSHGKEFEEVMKRRKRRGYY